MPQRMLVMLSVDPPGEGEALAAWTRGHVGEMLELPGILSAQAFRIDDEDSAYPGAPRYRNLCIYEVTDDFAGVRPGVDGRPLPTPPGGMKPNQPAGFLFVATTERLRRVP